MIHCFLINLAKDADRLSFMEGQFAKVGRTFERFSALTPSNLSADAWQKVDYEGINQTYNTQFRPGEVACAYSHKAILEKIVQEEIPLALILEDDVILDTDFFLFFDRIFSGVQQDRMPTWDYLQCNYHIMDAVNYIRFCKGTLDRFLMAARYRDKALLGMKFIVGIILAFYENTLNYIGKIVGPFVFPAIRPYSMAGTYFITYDGAKKILATMNNRIIAPADCIQNIASSEMGLKNRILIPQLSVQDSQFESNTLTIQ